VPADRVFGRRSGRSHRRSGRGRPSRAAGARGGGRVSEGERPRALADYLRLAADYLKTSGSTSPRLDAELLLGHVLGLDRVALYVNFDRPLVPEEVDAFRELLRRRARGTPIAYILGRKPFLDT